MKNSKNYANHIEKFYKNKKVFLTGHTGFKGSWLTAWLKLIGANIMGISLNVPTNPSHYKVSKIKRAISAGEYPLDLDKISDALMQAYREMKS